MSCEKQKCCILGEHEWKALRKKYPNCFTVTHSKTYDYCFLNYRGLSVGSWKRGCGMERFVVLRTVYDTMTTLNILGDLKK